MNDTMTKIFYYSEINSFDSNYRCYNFENNAVHGDCGKLESIERSCSNMDSNNKAHLLKGLILKDENPLNLAKRIEERCEDCSVMSNHHDFYRGVKISICEYKIISMNLLYDRVKYIVSINNQKFIL